MDALSTQMRIEIREKILASYRAIYSLSEKDCVILKDNLEHMADHELYREIALIENFGQKMKALTEKAAIETLKYREEEERAQININVDSLFI